MQEKLSPRLCSEIKLFDLCLSENCIYKNGRFCSNPVVLEKFENISESEDRFPADSYCDDGSDDDEDSDYSGLYSVDEIDEEEVGHD